MQTDQVITKISQIIPRKDGSEVKIVAQQSTASGGTGSIGVCVLRRQSPQHDWKPCSDRPRPDWRTMSVDEYVKHGRSEMLQAVSHGEILKVASAIGKPMSYRN